MPDPESVRRVGADVLQWGGWGGAVFLLVWGTMNYDPSKGEFAPQWVSFTFILCIGLAIAGTTVKARMRLSDTIIAAMKMGFQISEDSRKEDDGDG